MPTHREAALLLLSASKSLWWPLPSLLRGAKRVINLSSTCHFIATVHILVKGTQAWDNFEIFLPTSKLYMPLVNFQKNFDSFPTIFARISIFENFRGDWAYAEPNFFGELSKIFTLVLLDGFLYGFSKFRLFTVKICILIWYIWVIFENYSMSSMLSICGYDFIAHWAYEETILSHTEHTRNEFSRMLSQR